MSQAPSLGNTRPQNNTKLSKRLARAVGLAVLKGLVSLLPRLPLPVALGLGRGLGNLMRVVSKKRRKVALDNLAWALGPAHSEGERRRIAWESFRQFGMLMVEQIWYAFRSPEQIDEVIEFREEDWNDFAALHARGKGVIFVTAHLGNFEMQARIPAARGVEVLLLVRPSRDQGTTELITRLRERTGLKVVETGKGLRTILEGLRRGACVAMVSDQNAGDVFVPFFGRQTGFVDGAARLALKTGSAIILCYCVRVGPGRFRMLYSGGFVPEPTGDTTADIDTIMRRVADDSEAAIRAYPEQWLWFHNRWKSSPPPPERPSGPAKE
jgi:KDO2-lipid IV(A) lauroyltransferase